MTKESVLVNSVATGSGLGVIMVFLQASNRP